MKTPPSPTAFVFVTANQSKHREVSLLLSGLDIRWERLDLARPPGEDLAAKVGLSPEQVEQAVAALGQAHNQEGDTVTTAANETGLPAGKLQERACDGPVMSRLVDLQLLLRCDPDDPLNDGSCR